MSSEAGQQEHRKLAAIMFTDIVGYSALTQADEARALEVLERHNKLPTPFFAKYHGREVKRIGDSFLVEFDSALDAVNCSVDIQKSLHDYNLSAHDDKWKIKIRIGIHLGDVVHKDGDVFGDAVNVTSRIEPLAEPEGVCVSEQIFDQIQNKISQPLSKLPQTNLKNIQFRIDAYKLVMPWEMERTQSLSRPSLKERIAILPFVSMSPDPADEFFADGLTEELISKLSLVKGLRVIARTSVMRYKNKDKGILDIGKELGVGYLVEGSVRKAANRIRVTAQLIDTESEEHLWASSYDKNLDDVFAVQMDIAGKISESLLGNIASPAFGVIKGETTNVTAWSYYLKGIQLMNEKSDESLQRALELFEGATKLDPSFARAYIESGNCYAYLGMRSTISFEDGLGGMKASAQKALEIDENLAETHALLSLIAWVEDDHVTDEREALRAIELNPNLADAHLRLSYVKSTNGHLNESISILEKALSLDPLSADIVGSLGIEYFWSSREKDALELWNRSRKILPYVVASNMFEYYLEKRDIEKAEEQLKILESFPGGASYESMVSRTELLAMKGDRKAIEEAISTLEKSFKGTAANDRNIGFIRLYLGDKEAFFAAMFRAVETHVLDPSRLRYSFLLEDARKDPRYFEVLRRNGVELDPQE